VFPLFGERVFFAGMRALDPQRADALAALPGMPLARGVAMTLARMGYFIGGTLLAFLLALIPVVGAILGPLLQLYLTARVMTWELLDPLFDKRQMYLGDQRVFVQRHRASFVGFGLPYTLLLSLPLVGPLFFGLAQAAVATLVVTVLEPEGDPSLSVAPAPAPTSLPA
jgi:uncharacterized protein involved in cysteine biosynthesis